MLTRFITLSIFCLFAFSCGQQVQPVVKNEAVPMIPPPMEAAIPDPEKITTVEGITEYRLHNGLRVLLFPDPSKQTITVNVTYKVGSKHENYGETGMAHLLEHMVFKGTPNHPNVKEEITQKGNRWNGTTWYDRTNYFETFSATEETLDWALDMEADRMINSNITREDLDSEMTVVRNEFEAGENNPIQVLMQRMMATAFLWHNYGKSTIGARTDIENVPIPRLQAFYKKYYQPDNAVLTVAGQFETEKTIQKINKYFGKIQKPERVLPEIYTEDPVQDGERTVTLERVGDFKVVGSLYHVPPGSHADYPGISLLSHIMGNEPSGRLYKKLVETKKAANVIGLDFQLEEPGMALFGAIVPKDNDLEETRKIMMETLDDLQKKPPSVEEIERARNAQIKQIEQAFSSSESICLQLSEWIGMGDWRLFFVNRDRLENISVEDVQRIAKTYFKPSNRTVGLFIPTEKPDRVTIPSAPDISSLVDGYTGKKAVAMGEAFDPSVENIENRTERFILPNGMKVALLPKKTRNQTINMSLTLLYGDENSLKNKDMLVQLTGNMLNRGTKDRSRQEIKDDLDKLKSSVNVFASDNFVLVLGQTTRPNVVAATKLLATILKEPSFPKEEFEALKLERKTGIEANQSEPNAKASIELSRQTNPYPKGDIRYVSSFEEQIADLEGTTLAQLKEFHQDFYGAENATISLVGDFDAKEMKALLTEIFGDWTSKTSYARLENGYKEVPIINKNLEAPDKKNAFFFARQQFPFDPEQADYPAMELGIYMVGSGFQSRLVQRIREKEGLSYGVGGNFEAHPVDKKGTFNAYAIYNPDNVEKLEAAFRDEMTNVLTKGFTQEEVDKAKESWAKGREVNTRSQDNALARQLSLYHEWGRNMHWDGKLEKKVSKLTASEVNAALAKYIDLDKMHMVKSGDFARNNKDGKP